MPSSEPISIALVTLVILVIFMAAVVASSRLSDVVKMLLCAGLGLRLVGALTRYEVLFKFYDGSGDARVYYKTGLLHAEYFKRLDVSQVFDSSAWWGGTFPGTQFVRFVSGGVLTIIGPSLRSEFVVFSLLAFAGLLAFAVAFARSYPRINLGRYLVWIMLFPSLWYWPSSVGKEAILLLGIGITVLGFVGRGGRVNWIVIVTGLLLVYATRPQVLGILLVAILLSQWSFSEAWSLGKIIHTIGVVAVCVMGIWYTSKSLGIEQFDVEGIQSYVESEKGREATGGTQVNPVGTKLTAAPVAFFNVLFRPLPWEATNVMVLLSSVETLSLWIIVARRRKNLLSTVRNWRSDRLVRLSILFIGFYAIALGMMVINLGVIARQRVFLFPFVFLLLEASSHAAKRRAPVRRLYTIPTSRADRLIRQAPPS
jgi:hypothetical protein